MSTRQLAVAFVTLGTLWGSSFVAIDLGLPYFPPLEFAGLRFLIAGVVILAYAWLTTPRWRPRGRREWLLAGVAGAFLIGGHHSFLYLGQQYLNGAVAAIVVSLGPVLTALFAVAILDAHLSALDGLGFAFGLFGVLLVAQPGIAEESSLPLGERIAALDPGALLAGDMTGIVLVFLAAASFALGGVLTRTIETTLPMRTVQAWAMLIGAALLMLTLDTADAPAIVEHAPDLLVPGGFVAVYSPFVESMRETVETLDSVGMDADTYETIQREMDVDERGTRPSTAGVGHTGYLVFARK